MNEAGTIGHAVSVVLHHTVNLLFYSTDSSIASVHLCSNNPLPPSPVRLQPHSAGHINTCRNAQIYSTHHFSRLLGGSEGHTHTYTLSLTIDVLETLCNSTWNMPSYLPHSPSLSHKLTYSRMHIYTLLCEPNKFRQALLSCDRAWNKETTEHYEPSLTSAVLIQFVL